MFVGVHTDGQSEQRWQAGPVYTVSQDDHISMTSMTCQSSGSIVAAIKTSKSSELIVLLISDAGADPSVQANWTSYIVYNSSADSPTRPIILIDETNREYYVFTRNKYNGTKQAIYYKKTSMDNINFPSGNGTPFIKSSSDTKLNDATSTRQLLWSS